jgi:hypothetical protein
MAVILVTMPFYVTAPYHDPVFRQSVARLNQNGALELACFRRSFAKRIRITHWANRGELCRPTGCLTNEGNLY